MPKTQEFLESLETLLRKQGLRVNLRTNNTEEIHNAIEFLERASKSALNEGDKLGARFKCAYLRDKLARQQEKKSFELAEEFRTEIILRFAGTMRAGKFVVDRETASLLIEQLSYIVVNSWLSFSVRPLDRDYCIVNYAVDYNKISNGYLYTINEQYGLNLPLHSKEDEPVLDEYDRTDTPNPYAHDVRFIKHGANLRQYC